MQKLKAKLYCEEGELGGSECIWGSGKPLQEVARNQRFITPNKSQPPRLRNYTALSIAPPWLPVLLLISRNTFEETNSVFSKFVSKLPLQ